METTSLKLSVSDFVALVNQTFEYALPNVVIVGEVSGFSIRADKWVRFKLKDETSSVDFFGSIYQVRAPLEDGMMIAVLGRPRLSDKWGFSVSIQSVQPVGEGSIKRGFELLKQKLHAEGLFDEARKRVLPKIPKHIGLISSTQAAGYVDFVKILNDRWGGMRVDVAHTLVQGIHAPGQIVRAIEYFNQSGEPPEVIVLVRGGGDADDLAAFNDEALVRAIASSRIPTLVGVGHEIDVTLADLAADVRAATPSNAAEQLVPNRRELIERAWGVVRQIIPTIGTKISDHEREVQDIVTTSERRLMEYLRSYQDEVSAMQRLLRQYNPQTVLERGYALVRGEIQVGAVIEIERNNDVIEAEVKNVRQK